MLILGVISEIQYAILQKNVENIGLCNDGHSSHHSKKRITTATVILTPLIQIQLLLLINWFNDPARFGNAICNI